MSHNRLAQLSGAAGLSSLRTLDVSCNRLGRLEELAVVRGASLLGTLDVRGNPLDKVGFWGLARGFGTEVLAWGFWHGGLGSNRSGPGPAPDLPAMLSGSRGVSNGATQRVLSPGPRHAPRRPSQPGPLPYAPAVSPLTNSPPLPPRHCRTSTHCRTPTYCRTPTHCRTPTAGVVAAAAVRRPCVCGCTWCTCCPRWSCWTAWRWRARKRWGGVAEQCGRVGCAPVLEK